MCTAAYTEKQGNAKAHMILFIYRSYWLLGPTYSHISKYPVIIAQVKVSTAENYTTITTHKLLS